MSMKMWRVNIKLWIVTLFCSTVACQLGNYYGNPTGIMFPGPVAPVYNKKITYEDSSSDCTDCQSVMLRSLEFAKEINELDTFDEIMDFVARKSGSGRDILLAARLEDENERKVKAYPPKDVGRCKPTQKLIRITEENSNSSIFYFPSCMRVKRCNGCCNSEVWSCQATKTTIITVRVLKVRLLLNKTEYMGEQKIPVEEHINCQCQCSQKKENCTRHQIYIENECRCGCANVDEKKKCNNSKLKEWDDKKCECRCPEDKDKDCNTGLYFDNDTCSCQTREHFNNTGSTSHSFKTASRNHKDEKK